MEQNTIKDSIKVNEAQEGDNQENNNKITNNQPKILNALIKAHNRGVKIRRVYDYSNKKYYEDNDKLDNIIIDKRDCSL